MTSFQFIRSLACVSMFAFAAAAPAAAQSNVGRAVLDAVAGEPAEDGAGGCNIFINYVDTPVAVSFNQFGEFRVPLNGDPVLDVSQCRRLHYEIGTHNSTASSYKIVFGKISGATLAQSFPGTPDNKIHSMEVVGPEMALWLTGPKNTKTSTQLWIWLTD